jgi:lipoate-protein ligase B
MLGKISYDDAERIQLQERERVKDGKSAGAIFFLEHDPAVITLGKNAIASNVLLPERLLASKGYHVRKVSRGGDVTVHEPGQLVVYFVLPLKAKAVRTFVDSIVSSVKSVLNKYGIKAEFDEKRPGIWVADKKICSIGLDLRERVSMHGIALNVCNDLNGFKLIVPCGLSGVKLSTVSLEAGFKISVHDLAKELKDILNDALVG